MRKISVLVVLMLLSTAIFIALPTLSFAQSSVGEVTDIDLDASKIKLKHNGIKNLDIPAMKMFFRVADPGWLTTLRVGDKVKFDAEKIGSQFTVTALVLDK